MNELIDVNRYMGKLPCSMIFNCFHITYEGYLTACCVDEENLLFIADLNQVPLAEAWHSEKFVDLRQRHLCGNKQKIGNILCRNCLESEMIREIEPL